VHRLTHGRAVEAARLVPVGLHTAVEASTIDCIFGGLKHWSCGWRNDTLYRFWWVRDGGGRPQSLERKEIHSLLHDAPYSAVVQAG
jgi:hypothetical protein